MTYNEYTLILIMLWYMWAIFGTGFAFLRLVIGMLGFKEGRNKFSWFKNWFYWFCANAIFTVIWWDYGRGIV